MNAFGYLKKIFNSFDFMGNRIKRLRVDTPENFIDDKNPDKSANPVYREDINGIKTPDQISAEMNRGSGTKYNEKDYDRYKDFVANKNYVDKSVDYNTEVAKNQELGTEASDKSNPSIEDLMDGKQGIQNQQRTPSQFPWVGKVFGLTVKEVIDKLLFPRIPYEFKYPKILSITIKTNNFLIQCLEQNASTNKFLIYEGVENKLFLDIYLDNGDWNGSQNAKLILIDSNNIEYTYDITDGITHIVGNISINKFPENIVKVLIRQIYDTPAIKYDTWGYESKPKLKDNPNIEISTYNVEFDITDEFLKQCYIWYIKHDENFINKLQLSADYTVTNDINLQIKQLTSSDYYLKCYIFNSNNKLLNSFIINQNEINSDGKIQYNFGTYLEQVYIKFKPVPVLTNTGYSQND